MVLLSLTMGTCPHADKIGSYVSCTLDETQAKEIDDHLITCETCQHVLATVIESGVGPEWLAEYHASRETAASHETPTVAHVPSATATVIRPGLPRVTLPTSPHERYQFVRLCGEGGMGRVWEGWDQVMKRRVALKQLRTSGEASSQRQRFLQEASSLARLSHPNIVSVFEVLELDQQPTLVMEFVEGTTLSAHTKEVVLVEKQALRILERLTEAVAHAHRQGVIHRDLKPANVLLSWPDATEDSPRNLDAAVPKLSDFGLAKTLANDDLTKTGELLGTPAYMAPEQTLGIASVVGFAADIYGLGAILYELLVGTPPHLAEDPLATVLAVREHDPVSPRLLRPALSKDIETICLKCLQKAPKDRYESAEALREDLLACLDGRPIRARPVGFFTRALRWSNRNRPMVFAIAATVLLLLTIVLGSIWSAASERRLRLAANEATSRALVAEEKAKAEAARATAAFEKSENQSLLTFARLHDLAEINFFPKQRQTQLSPEEVERRINSSVVELYEFYLNSLPPPEQWTVRQALTVTYYVETMLNLSIAGRHEPWLEKLKSIIDKIEAENKDHEHLDQLIARYYQQMHRSASTSGDLEKAAYWSELGGRVVDRWSKEKGNPPNFQRIFSNALMKAATEYTDAGKYEDAMRTGAESVAVYRRVLETTGQNEEDRFNFFDKLVWFYFVAARAPRQDECSKIEREMLELSASFPQETPFRDRIEYLLQRYRKCKESVDAGTARENSTPLAPLQKE